MCRHRLLATVGLALAVTASLPATVYTWRGSGPDGDVTLATNWVGNRIPLFDGSEDFHFGNPVGSQYNPLIPVTGIIVHDLQFNAASRPTYTFSGTSLPTFELQGDLTIVTLGGDVIFDNTVKLKLSSGVHDFDLSPAGSKLTLNSMITGAGQMDLLGLGDLVLGGDNSSWSGGLVIWGDGTVDLNNANALGSGSLTFDSASDATVNVNQTMTINGLSGSSTTSEIYLYAGATLTLNQNSDATYDGYISDGVSPGSLIKTGTGALTLTGYSDYTGTTTINGGALIASGSGVSLGSNTITVNGGGTLAVVNGAWLGNWANVNSGGTLSGTGHVYNASLNAGSLLAPGDAGNPIGQLSFDDLTLGADGGMEWHAKNPTSYDSISVYNAATLTILATSTNPFVIHLLSVDANGRPGMATGFVLNQQYNFLLFTTNGISGFDPTHFTLDSSMFTTDGGPAGIFSLSNTGNDIFLNFIPVPEPSTYALIGLGLGAVLLPALRRRRIFQR